MQAYAKAGKHGKRSFAYYYLLLFCLRSPFHLPNTFLSKRTRFNACQRMYKRTNQFFYTGKKHQHIHTHRPLSSDLRRGTQSPSTPLRLGGTHSLGRTPLLTITKEVRVGGTHSLGRTPLLTVTKEVRVGGTLSLGRTPLLRSRKRSMWA